MLLLLATLSVLIAAGCQTPPAQSEARLERQLRRLERELESLSASSDLSSARQRERLARLQVEFQRTLTALGNHLETMAAHGAREGAEAADSDAKP